MNTGYLHQWIILGSVDTRTYFMTDTKLKPSYVIPALFQYAADLFSFDF